MKTTAMKTIEMKITINDLRKINAIQKEFNDVFPFLLIQFFCKPHTKAGASPKKQIEDSSKTLGECRTIHTKGHITIAPSMTAADIEEQFRDRYGLSVQVFRKSGKSWLETSATGEWTLEKQNAEGEALSHLK
jgi:uncharacterized pyridoxal phosphate-containing UPF0001 family protein